MGYIIINAKNIDALVYDVCILVEEFTMLFSRIDADHCAIYL